MSVRTEVDPLPSGMILSQNRVANFEDWLQGFRDHAESRLAGGLRERGIYKTEDGREVFVLLDVVDGARAQAFLASRELASFKESIGVQQAPKYHRVETLDRLVGPAGAVTEAFARIDAMDSTTFSAAFAETGVFQFANLPPVVGPTAVEAFCSRFFSAIQAIRHEVQHAFEGVTPRLATPCAQVRGLVHYTRKDGSRLSVPFSNYFETDTHGKFTLWQIYADTSPLFG